MTSGCSMQAMSRIGPVHRGQTRGSTSYTCLVSRAQARFAVEAGNRLAREMHGGLAPSLGHLHLKIQQARALGPSVAASPLAAALTELTTIAEEAYDEIRQSIFGLRTMVTRSRRLAPTLTEFLHEFSERHGLAGKLEMDGAEALRLPWEPSWKSPPPLEREPG